MRRSFHRSAIASLLIMVLSIHPAAWSWGNTGHEAVACAAWKLLDQSTKDKVWALLQRVPTRTGTKGTKSFTIPGFAEWTADLTADMPEDQRRMFVFMRAATWADTIKHSFLQDSDVVPPDLNEATSNIGFTDTESHGYWHFVDNSFGSVAKAGSTPPDYPKACLFKDTAGNLEPPPTPVRALPPTPAVNAKTEIVLLSGKLASVEDPDLMAYDMIWLEHLVGDLHQPLHAAVRMVRGVGDTGGNCVEIKVPTALVVHFRTIDPKAEAPRELHAFWDDLPGISKQMETQGAVDYAAGLPAADAELAKVDDPTVWMDESLSMAKKDVYRSPIVKGMGSPTAFTITQAYYDRAAADAQTRVALAGARLANLLEASLKSWTPAGPAGRLRAPARPVPPSHRPRPVNAALEVR